MGTNNLKIDIGTNQCTCPHCKALFDDSSDKMLDYINHLIATKGRDWTDVECQNCRTKFGITYDYRGKMQSFELK